MRTEERSEVCSKVRTSGVLQSALQLCAPAPGVHLVPPSFAHLSRASGVEP